MINESLSLNELGPFFTVVKSKTGMDPVPTEAEITVVSSVVSDDKFCFVVRGVLEHYRCPKKTVILMFTSIKIQLREISPLWVAKRHSGKCG